MYIPVQDVQKKIVFHSQRHNNTDLKETNYLSNINFYWDTFLSCQILQLLGSLKWQYNRKIMMNNKLFANQRAKLKEIFGFQGDIGFSSYTF